MESIYSDNGYLLSHMVVTMQVVTIILMLVCWHANVPFWGGFEVRNNLDYHHWNALSTRSTHWVVGLSWTTLPSGLARRL